MKVGDKVFTFCDRTIRAGIVVATSPDDDGLCDGEAEVRYSPSASAQLEVAAYLYPTADAARDAYAKSNAARIALWRAWIAATEAIDVDALRVVDETEAK